MRYRPKWVFGCAVFFFVLTGCLGLLPGAGTLKAIGIEGKIERNIPIGSTVEQVDTFLENQGIEHSYVDRNREVFGLDAGASQKYSNGGRIISIIRYTKSGFLISEHLQMYFSFDHTGRMYSYVLKPVGDGP